MSSRPIIVLAIIIYYNVVAGSQSHTNVKFGQPYLSGRGLYNEHCAMCHGNDGRGWDGIVPPLAKSDYLANKRDSSIWIIKYGWKSPLYVNKVSYTASMPGFEFLTDRQISDIMHYITNTWGNQDTIAYNDLKIKTTINALGRSKNTNPKNP